VSFTSCFALALLFFLAVRGEDPERSQSARVSRRREKRDRKGAKTKRATRNHGGGRNRRTKTKPKKDATMGGAHAAIRFSLPLYLVSAGLGSDGEHGRVLFLSRALLPLQRRAAGGFDKGGERGPRARKRAVEPPMLSAHCSLEERLLRGAAERGEEVRRVQQQRGRLLLLRRWRRVHGDDGKERARFSLSSSELHSLDARDGFFSLF
jgi:hypothetical protein